LRAVPVDGDELPELRDALDKLKLNDASFTFEPSPPTPSASASAAASSASCHGDRRERLEREFDLSLIATAPSSRTGPF